MYTACAFWQATGTGHIWCFNNGRVVAHEWVANCDPALYFPSREDAQRAIDAARNDGRIRPGMRVCINYCEE